MVLGTTSGMATASVGMASVTRMATRTNLARATSRLEGMDSQVGPAWRRTRSTCPDIEEVPLSIAESRPYSRTGAFARDHRGQSLPALYWWPLAEG